MTAPDTDTLIALAREGRIAVVPVEATLSDRCPTCRTNWKFTPPVKCDGSDHFRCIECKATYQPTTPTLTPALLALAEERDRLREALKPFAKAAPSTAVPDRHAMLFEGLGENCKVALTAADFRNAARALTGDTP